MTINKDDLGKVREEGGTARGTVKIILAPPGVALERVVWSLKIPHIR